MIEPRIVCVGANLESEIAIKHLVKENVNVVGLITLPASSSSGVSDYIDLHEFCNANSIATIDTTDINSQECLTQLKSLAPDYIFTLGWSSLFKDELLSTPTHFIVGSHPAPLPAGRGRAPVPWTILQGQEKSAVSLFRMNLGVDAGPLLKQIWFDVPPRSTAWDVYMLVAKGLAEGFAALYKDILSDSVVETAQDLTISSVRGKRVPEDGHIDFRCMKAAEVDRLVRAVSKPFPGAYSYHRQRKVIFENCSLEDIPNYVGVAGQILTRRKGKTLVQCADKPIWLYDMQVDGLHLSNKELSIGSKFGFQVEDEISLLKRQVAELKSALENINQRLNEGDKQ